MIGITKRSKMQERDRGVEARVTKDKQSKIPGP